MAKTQIDLRSYVFDNGPAHLLGILPDRSLGNPPGQEFVVRLGQRAHAYNVRQRKYLGHVASVEAGIRETEAKLLAFLPERIEGIAVLVDRAKAKPGQTVTAKIRVHPEALSQVRFAVRVEVLRGDTPVPAYGRNVWVTGTTAYPLPLALNEPAGDARVRVTEVVSGFTAETGFEVR